MNMSNGLDWLFIVKDKYTLLLMHFIDTTALILAVAVLESGSFDLMTMEYNPVKNQNYGRMYFRYNNVGMSIRINKYYVA